MLNLFRSFRQIFIAENKTTKYLKYAIGEIVLVMIGILLALQVNTWNQNRLLRIEEIEAKTRIVTDLGKDIGTIEGRMKRLKSKEVSLLRVKSAIAEGNVINSQSFLEDILEGTHQGWIQASTSRSTYDDLIGSGKLGIIENPDVRANISDYYNSFQIVVENLERRQTNYPNLTSQYIPKGENGRRVKSGLNNEEMKGLVSDILKSPIKHYLTAEINFGRFTNKQSSNIKDQAEDLIEVLKTYQTEIKK
jgi:hypothetical protein